MKSDKNCHDYLRDIVKDLKDEKLPAIDFDILVSRLEEVAEILEQGESIVSEVNLFRTDYQGRIAGMIKAMAVVDRKTATVETALEAIEQLQDLDAEGLIKSYRSNSAKFRDSFPTSFGSLSMSGESGHRLKDISDFK